MKLKTIASIGRDLFRRGPWATFHSLRYRLMEKYLDYWLGIDTAQEQAFERIPSPGARPYVPSDYFFFAALMKSCNVRRDFDVLVDFGSGKGRSTIMSAFYPFKRIIGIEFSAELCRIAEENIRRVRGKLHCKNIAIVHGDAASFPIPPDMTIAYFFNPFAGPVLDGVLANIKRSLDDFPRRIQVVCNSPSSQAEFVLQIDRCPWLTRVKTVKLSGSGQEGAIYTNQENNAR